jgi:hypothetical protein
MKKVRAVWKRSDREWHTPLPSFASVPSFRSTLIPLQFHQSGNSSLSPSIFLLVITTLCPLIDAFFCLMVIFQGSLSLGVMSSPNLAGPEFQDFPDSCLFQFKLCMWILSAMHAFLSLIFSSHRIPHVFERVLAVWPLPLLIDAI